VTRDRKTLGILVVLAFILPLSFISVGPRLVHDLDQTKSDDGYIPPKPNITNRDRPNLQETECSSVIVTGSAAKNGRAILMKNRDYILDRANRPYYVAATTKTFAYVTINYHTMGINEKGLAVMNTAMPILEPMAGEGNLELNRLILENYESVDEVAMNLNDTYSGIGPNFRCNLGTIATCVGIIDRFGEGAFFEISNTEAYVQYIVNGYDTRANHPRIFPGVASGPSGRDQYLLDALDQVYAENGVISWEDVMQNISRYVHNQELGSTTFTIDGEVCNPNTVAAMVAVSGDSRYDGKLNCMWAACGLIPLTGVYVPSMAYAGEVPDSVTNLHSYCLDKYQSAQVQSNPFELYPSRVREIQSYAFFAEDFTIDEYDKLMSSVPEGLSDFQIESCLSEFIERMDDFAANVFIGETTEIEVPLSTSFPDPTTSVTSTSSSISTTSTSSSDSTTSNLTSGQSTSVMTAIGMVVGFTVVVVIALVKWRDI